MMFHNQASRWHAIDLRVKGAPVDNHQIEVDEHDMLKLEK